MQDMSIVNDAVSYFKDIYDESDNVEEYATDVYVGDYAVNVRVKKETIKDDELLTDTIKKQLGWVSLCRIQR